jgi:hypothetical protein
MKTQNFFVRAGSAVMAVGFSMLGLMMFHQNWRGRELVPGVLLFVLFWAIFYRIGIWVVVDRPAELRKRIPISGNELRETRKEFYDWLASQGAPPQRKRNTKHLS